MSGLHPARASREDTPRGWHRRTGRRAGRARRRCAPLVYRGDVCVVCVTCVGENVAPSHAGSLCTQLTADTVPYSMWRRAREGGKGVRGLRHQIGGVRV